MSEWFRPGFCPFILKVFILMFKREQKKVKKLKKVVDKNGMAWKYSKRRRERAVRNFKKFRKKNKKVVDKRKRL